MSKNTSSIAISIIKGVLALQVIGVIWLLFFSDITKDNAPIEQAYVPAATANNELGNLEDIKKQLALEKKRVAEMIEAQQKNAKQIASNSAKNASARNAEIEAMKAQNQELRQQLTEMSTSTRSLLDELKQNANAKISTEDQSFLKALEMVPGDASQTFTAPSVPSNNAESINRIIIADSDTPETSSDTISSRVSELMKTGDKISKDPASNTNLVIARNGAQNSRAAEKLNSLQSRIDSLLAKNSGSGSAPTPSADNAAYLKSLAPLEKERKNETRWVTVIQGDTLYLIAERAYNDGSLYPKIFEANPQVLTNPDLITVGQRLRVPL